MKTKRGSSEMWWIIMSAVLAIVIVIVIILWFRGSGGKAFDEVDTKIGGLGDCDKDNVGDLFDKCPCDANTGESYKEGQTKCEPECATPRVCAQ